MKNALILIIVALFALSCAHEDQMPLMGKVQFAVAPVDESSESGRIASSLFPEGAYISLSLETSTGANVYSHESIDLIQLGNGYVTAPFELLEGSYRVTDFFVMSAGGSVLYATPKETSPLAALVADPLPIDFTITADGILNLAVQVVAADQQSPKDFGYMSFGVEVVGSDYSVSLFVAEGGDLNFTSGKLELYQENDLVYEQYLDAKVNAINFKGDPSNTYTLVVRKQGYSIFHREYILHDFINELDGRPLSVLVKPALTVTIKDKNSDASLHTLLIDIFGSSSNLTIDWGDGTIQTGIDFSIAGPSHGYGNPGKIFYINIYGDIGGISSFGCNYQLPVDVLKIDVTSVAGLKDFTMVLTQDSAPKFIDFSKNPLLTNLSLSLSNIERIDISNNHSLSTLEISSTAI